MEKENNTTNKQFKKMAEMTPEEIKKEFDVVPVIMKRVKARDNSSYYTCQIQVVLGLVTKQLSSSEFGEEHYNRIGLSLRKSNPTLDPTSTNEIKFNAFARYSIGRNSTTREPFYLIEVAFDKYVKRTVFLSYLEIENYKEAREFNSKLPEFVERPLDEKDINVAM